MDLEVAIPPGVPADGSPPQRMLSAAPGTIAIPRHDRTHEQVSFELSYKHMQGPVNNHFALKMQAVRISVTPPAPISRIHISTEPPCILNVGIERK
jgi:hypothetical protein